jgi:hypothetical protein
MRGFWFGLSISVAFIVGCATARLVVPPVSAQSTTRWQYHCVESDQDAAEVTEAANQIGAQGWELVAGLPTNRFSQIWCFKSAL